MTDDPASKSPATDAIPTVPAEARRPGFLSTAVGLVLIAIFFGVLWGVGLPIFVIVRNVVIDLFSVVLVFLAKLLHLS